MAGEPVRLAIASPDEVVAAGLRKLLARHPERVVVVDDGPADVVLHDGDDAAAAAVLRRTGASSWVPLRGGVSRLVDLLEEAAAGPSFAAGAELSMRERQVLALITEGLTNQQIADRAFISINSVKTYIRSAYRKIGVSSRSQAVAWGLRHERRLRAR